MTEHFQHKTRFLATVLPLFVFALSSLGHAVNTLPTAEGSLADPNALDPTASGKSQDIVHGLVNLEFSNYHLTSRGLNLQDKGLISQPYLRLDWTLYRPKPAAESPVNEVTFTTAVWNDIDTVQSGVQPGHWNEIDPTIGPNIKFLKAWTLESPFTAYISETGSFPTCIAWDPHLTYHDHVFKDFSFNPYLEFFNELQNKVTVVFNQAQSKSSCYGVVGFDPTYSFMTIPLKLELPTYLTLPAEHFYQRADGAGGGSGLGLISTTFKVTVPLKFVAASYGKWSVYAGIQYDYLNNPGLLDGNEYAGAALSRQRNLVVLHGGITVHF